MTDEGSVALLTLTFCWQSMLNHSVEQSHQWKKTTREFKRSLVSSFSLEDTFESRGRKWYPADSPIDSRLFSWSLSESLTQEKTRTSSVSLVVCFKIWIDVTSCRGHFLSKCFSQVLSQFIYSSRDQCCMQSCVTYPVAWVGLERHVWLETSSFLFEKNDNIAWKSPCLWTPSVKRQSSCFNDSKRICSDSFCHV